MPILEYVSCKFYIYQNKVFIEIKRPNKKMKKIPSKTCEIKNKLKKKETGKPDVSLSTHPSHSSTRRIHFTRSIANESDQTMVNLNQHKLNAILILPKSKPL